MVPVTASTGPPGRNVGRRFIPIGTKFSRVQLLTEQLPAISRLEFSKKA